MSVFSLQSVAATDRIDFDYAVVRIVPLVHLCTFQNVGVVMHARTEGFLDTRLYLNRNHLTTLCPTLDIQVVERYLNAYQRICRGDPDARPLALLPAPQRFQWLTMTRSAVLQTSDIHSGRTRDPLETLEHLFKAHVEGA